MNIEHIKQKVFEIRSIKVMLDFDVAELYSVPTKSINLAAKRNSNRFPKDFRFQLKESEWVKIKKLIGIQDSKLKNETIKNGRGQHQKYLPYAYTEQGLAMLSGLLNSERAIEINIVIMRTFILMRQFALSHQELSKKIATLEAHFKRQFRDIDEALTYLMQQNSLEPIKPRKRIGFRPDNKLGPTNSKTPKR